MKSIHHVLFLTLQQSGKSQRFIVFNVHSRTFLIIKKQIHFSFFLVAIFHDIIMPDLIFSHKITNNKI